MNVRGLVATFFVFALSGAPSFGGVDPEADLAAKAADAYRDGRVSVAADLFDDYQVRFPQGRYIDVAELRSGLIWLNAGDIPSAIADFRAAADSPDGRIADRAAYLVGLAAYRAGEYSVADAMWTNSARTVMDEHVAARSQLGRAWCALRMHDWGAARSSLDRLNLLFPDDAVTPGANGLHRELRHADALPRRSLTKAKWLSTLLPGSGQVYAGRAGNGLMSMALNSAFIYLTAKAVAQDRWLDAGFLYLLGGRFYWGGRQNAVKFARAHNTAVANRFVASLERYQD